MPDRGKGGFNWITGADALPMLGREVEECHEFFAVLLQTPRRFGIFGLVDFDEQIERLFRIIFGFGLPDVVDRGFGLWLRQLRQAVEYVYRFVLPTPLLAGLGIQFLLCLPKAHRAVHCLTVVCLQTMRGADGQLGSIHPPAFEAEQNLTPTLRGLAYSILDSQEPLLATGHYPNNHEGA
jgi:hypothetical protein